MDQDWKTGELVRIIHNEAVFARPRELVSAALRRKVLEGKYNVAAAPRAWLPVVKQAIVYAKQSGKYELPRYSVDEKKHVAEALARGFVASTVLDFDIPIGDTLVTLRKGPLTNTALGFDLWQYSYPDALGGPEHHGQFKPSSSFKGVLAMMKREIAKMHAKWRLAVVIEDKLTEAIYQVDKHSTAATRRKMHTLFQKLPGSLRSQYSDQVQMRMK